MLSTLFLSLLTPALTPVLPGYDDALKSRELAGISEEQALLVRQLKRLRQTMEILVLRLEAEGRPRAVELLEQGIALLDARERSTRALTLEEAMDDARERVKSGQVVQSLDSQDEVIGGLERLLAILMERGNLDNIEENLDRVREMKEKLDALASEERELRRETRELRRGAANEEQRELESGIAGAMSEQRKLLDENERAGRESGGLALEEIERSLQELRESQEADRGLLEAWRPRELEDVARAAADMEAARRSEARADRLDAGAEALRRLSEASPDATAEQSTRMEEALEKRLDRAERHARASNDDAAQDVAEALAEALETLRTARQENQDGTRAAERMEELAESLEERGSSERAAADEARERVAEELEDLADEESVAGLVASDVREALSRAGASAREGRDSPGQPRSGDPRARDEAAKATEEAAHLLRAGQNDLERMAEALSGSQSSLANEAERLERALESLPQGESPEGQEAREQLDEAAEAMRATATEAGRGSPMEAREDADRAQRALEAAQEALEGARARSAQQDSSGRAQRQQELAQSMGELGQKARQGSMDGASEAQVDKALSEAERAMERASDELEENRGASAAEAQRKALEALSRAAQSARDGVRPSTPEDQKRAEELAREQERIREEILQLALRDEEKRNPGAIAGLERAQEEAQQAESELRSGELDDAEQSERQVERELDRARDELEKEEDQYEALRQEELLFRITEEVQTALDSHREQMAGTAEIEANRGDAARPSRAQRLRLRRISREEDAIAERIGEIAQALEAEESVVFAEILRQTQTDLREVAVDLSDQGDHDTGERVRAVQRDVEERLEWLLEALQEEQRRREQDQNEQQQQQQQQQQQESENRLVPNQAELKLLRRMEIEIQEGIERLLILYPELSELDAADVDPLVLDDVMRLAVRHERTSDLFATFRSRLGLPEPGSAGNDSGGEPVAPQDEDDTEEDE